MRICRFDNDRVGVVRQDLVYDVTAVLEKLKAHTYPYPCHDVFIEALPHLNAAMEAAADQSVGIPIERVQLLAPVANPGKLIGAPVNYQKHLSEARLDPAISFNRQVDEIQRIGLFLKATSSLVGVHRPIALRFPERRNDHEIELVAVIGKVADRVTEADALSYVAGYTVGIDMTVRGTEERSMRKSADTFSIIGPVLVTSDEFGDPGNVELELAVNGTTRQKANTKDLVLSVSKLVEYASTFYTLYPGDVIFTGTPEGVGEVKAGDTIRASIERIGAMETRVVLA